MSDTETLRGAALTYAARGWAVIPVHSLRPEGGCTCPRRLGCPTPAKHPIGEDWQNRGSTSAADIYAWWEDHPHANVGIVTGAASGVWVLDVDPANGGLTSLISLAEEHGQLPATRTHETGNAGLHYLFTVPPGVVIPTTAKSLGQGLDTRGDGNGMVAMPPSVAKAGAYRVVVDVEPIPAPGWLLDRLAEIQARREAGRTTEPKTAEPLDPASLPAKLRDRLADLDVADRSAHFHGTVAACRRARLSQGQTVTALATWCAVVDKFAGRVEAEVARSWGKLEDADPANSAEAWLAGMPAPGGPGLDALAGLIALAREYQDLPDPAHIVITLAVAATRDTPDDPVWLLIVAPPSSGKTETIRGLKICADAHLDDVTAAGLLSWKAGKNPHPVGVLTRVGNRALLTFGDLSTLLAASDRGARDTAFALLRRVYDGHVVRDLGTAPAPLSWEGKATIIGAVTGAIDNYSAHADALGPRWIYVRLPNRSSAEKQRAAALARRGSLTEYREAFATAAAQIVYAARSRIAAIPIPEELHTAIEEAAMVTCWGRAAVPRTGYGRQEITGVPVIEEPPRLVKQLTGLGRGLLALGLPVDDAVALVRRVALDSMPGTRRAVLGVLAGAVEPLATAQVARLAGLDRHVTRRNLEELELIGVVTAERRGEEPEEHEPDRRPAMWFLHGSDGDLVAEIIIAAIKDGRGWGCAELGDAPPTPPKNKGKSTCVHPTSQSTSGDGRHRDTPYVSVHPRTAPHLRVIPGDQ